MEFAPYAKQLAEHILAAEQRTKEKIRQKMKHRTVEDVAVLQTMLGGSLKSSTNSKKSLSQWPILNFAPWGKH
jgi:hypothetical protein